VPPLERSPGIAVLAVEAHVQRRVVPGDAHASLLERRSAAVGELEGGKRRDLVPAWRLGIGEVDRTGGAGDVPMEEGDHEVELSPRLELGIDFSAANSPWRNLSSPASRRRRSWRRCARSRGRAAPSWWWRSGSARGATFT